MTHTSRGGAPKHDGNNSRNGVLPGRRAGLLPGGSGTGGGGLPGPGRLLQQPGRLWPDPGEIGPERAADHGGHGHPRAGVRPVLGAGAEGRAGGGEGLQRQPGLPLPLHHRSAGRGLAHQPGRRAAPEGAGGDDPRRRGAVRPGQAGHLGRHPGHRDERGRQRVPERRGADVRRTGRGRRRAGGRPPDDRRRRAQGAVRHPRGAEHRPGRSLRRVRQGDGGQGRLGHRPARQRGPAELGGERDRRRR